jgi:DNA-directed RNA polymerase specialized sigma24 family protein
MQPEPQEIVEDKERRIISWSAVWALPEHLRKVITHLYICDRSHEETATMLGVDSDTLQKLHDKALANLRSRINSWQ